MTASRYGITATVETHDGHGWTRSGQVPYFEINGDVQGIRNEGQARLIAEVILSAGVLPTTDGSQVHFQITAVAL